YAATTSPIARTRWSLESRWPTVSWREEDASSWRNVIGGAAYAPSRTGRGFRLADASARWQANRPHAAASTGPGLRDSRTGVRRRARTRAGHRGRTFPHLAHT